MEESWYYTLKLFGIEYKLYDSMIMIWVIMAVIIAAAILLTRNLKTIPDGKQNMVESFVEFVNNMTKSNIEHHWRSFAPYFGTIMIFLLVSNMTSLFSILPTTEDLKHFGIISEHSHFEMFKIIPPTKDINVAAPMAIMSICLVLFAGIRYKKVSGWLKSFIQPIPVILPFKILDYVSRPLSLCLRLFGNIFAGYVIMELVYSLSIPVFPAVASFYFDIFDGGLQAYIFVFLTSIYVMEAIE